MTTTELYSGYDGKSSSRVLRPPGGNSSNIFGTDESAPQSHQQQQQKEQHQQQREAMADTNQNQAGGAAAAAGQADANRQKNREGAPYASFAESGNEADFRSYSVTAYRDAVNLNAAIKQKARGQANGAFNPITHEEKESDELPYKDHEQRRPRPQQQVQASEVQRPQRAQARVPAYNPITGEEYPSTYGQQNEEEKEEDEEEENQQDGQTSEAVDSTTKPAPPETKPEPQQGPPPVKKPSTRVRQPPGGASAGLW